MTEDIAGGDRHAVHTQLLRKALLHPPAGLAGGVEGAYRASCHGLEYPFFTFLQALLRVQELADPDRYFITVGNRNGVTTMGTPRHHRLRMSLSQIAQVIQDICHIGLEYPMDFIGDIELTGLLDILGGHAVMDVFSTLLAAGLYQHLYKWHKAMAYLCLNAIHFFQIDSLQFCIFYDIVCCAAGNKAFLCLRVSQRSLRKEPGFYLCFLCK